MVKRWAPDKISGCFFFEGPLLQGRQDAAGGMPRLKGAHGSREIENVGASNVSSSEVKTKLPAHLDSWLSARVFTAVSHVQIKSNIFINVPI